MFLEKMMETRVTDRKPSPFTVVILFANGSWGIHDFRSFLDARDFYRNRISYTNRVQRVTVMENGNELRAVWDESWDDQSKYAGLNN
jgi:hypothetical protein